jgi:aromatic ring-cleaving dioxygenase
LSSIYKAYKASGGKISTPKVNVQSVSSPLSNDVKARDKSLFFPPLPGQSSVDYHPQLRNLASNDSIVYYSWHVHVYFFHEDKNVTERTLALRDQFITKFGLAQCNDSCFMGGPFDTCNQGLVFHCSLFVYLILYLILHRNVRLGTLLWRGWTSPFRYYLSSLSCTYVVTILNFPSGQWGVYLPNEYVLETVSWMSANHGEFEVMFHPNTGYMVGGKSMWFV